MEVRDLVCGPLTSGQANRLAANGLRATLWKRADGEQAATLTDVLITASDGDVLTLELPDGRRELVDRRRLFVPSRVVRRLNLDGPLARMLDVLALLP